MKPVSSLVEIRPLLTTLRPFKTIAVNPEPAVPPADCLNGMMIAESVEPSEVSPSDSMNLIPLPSPATKDRMILWPESSPNAPAQPSGSPALSELLTDFNFATLLLPIASAAVASSPSKVNVMDVADFAAGSSVALSDGVVGCGVAGWPPSSVLGGCAGCVVAACSPPSVLGDSAGVVADDCSPPSVLGDSAGLAGLVSVAVPLLSPLPTFSLATAAATAASISA